MTCITEHFAKLGAPVRVVRQSWGGVTADGRIILRVWSCCPIEFNYKKRQVVILASDENDSRFGAKERREHCDALLNGAAGFLVFITEKTPDWNIVQYNDQKLFPIIKVETMSDGAVVATFGNPIDVKDFK